MLEQPFAKLAVIPGAERGLLGIALHPGFPEEPFVYVYLSDPASGRNLLLRLRAEGGRAADREVLLVGLPAATGYHNGGDLAFGADGMLYASLGEGHEPSLAQDPSSLGGKVLRLAPDGGVPPDNPFGPGSYVYSLGHRNSFGLCVNPATGDLWETENGPDRDDEVNLIVAGGNYGWPTHLGAGGAPRFVPPKLVFPEVIVPTGCAFTAPDRLWFGDFHGDLHLVRLSGPGLRQVADERVVVSVGAGITDVAVGPGGTLYVATADAILRVSGLPSAPPPGPASPSPETAGPIGSPVSPTALPPAAPPSRGGGVGVAVAVVVGAFLAAALLWSRRRLGR